MGEVSHGRQMTIKERLRAIRHLDLTIDAMLLQLDVERARAEKITSALSDVKVQESTANRQEEAYIRLIDYSLEVDKQIDRLIDEKREITELIMSLDRPLHRYILANRYICRKEWHEMAEELGYSTRQILRFHGKAIEAIARIV